MFCLKNKGTHFKTEWSNQKWCRVSGVASQEGGTLAYLDSIGFGPWVFVIGKRVEAWGTFSILHYIYSSLSIYIYYIILYILYFIYFYYISYIIYFVFYILFTIFHVLNILFFILYIICYILYIIYYLFYILYVIYYILYIILYTVYVDSIYSIYIYIYNIILNVIGWNTYSLTRISKSCLEAASCNISNKFKNHDAMCWTFHKSKTDTMECSRSLQSTRNAQGSRLLGGFSGFIPLGWSPLLVRYLLVNSHFYLIPHLFICD